MVATTASWLEKIEKASTKELNQIRSSLKDRLNVLVAEKRVLDEQRNRLHLDISFIESNLYAVNKRIANETFIDNGFSKSRLAVTDHAVLRYIERMLKLKVEGIRADIINGFPDQIPVDATCVRTGKTVYKIAKDKDKHVIVTIIRKR
jgi:hypothetical protein